MNKPGPVSEGLAVILWGASAVKVAGYTWQAYTGTYSQFPSEGGSNSGSLGFWNNPNNAVVKTVKKLPGGSTAVSVIQGAARAAANVLNVGDNTALSPLAPAHVPKLPPPSKRIPGQLYQTPNGLYDSAGNKVLGHGR